MQQLVRLIDEGDVFKHIQGWEVTFQDQAGIRLGPVRSGTNTPRLVHMKNYYNPLQKRSAAKFRRGIEFNPSFIQPHPRAFAHPCRQRLHFDKD